MRHEDPSEEVANHQAQVPSPRQGPQRGLLPQRRQSGRHADGNGLYLHVDPSGARRWVQRLVIRGRSRGLGLGSYALVSFAEARELALANRKLARASGDPLAAKRRAERMPSFEEASEKVVAIHSGGWKDGGKSAKQRRASLSEYAYARSDNQRIVAELPAQMTRTRLRPAAAGRSHARISTDMVLFGERRHVGVD